MAVMYDSVINDAYSEELLKSIRNEGLVQIIGGSDDLVMLTRERYELMKSLIDSAETELVKSGLRDIENGDVILAEQVMSGIKKEFDL